MLTSTHPFALLFSVPALGPTKCLSSVGLTGLLAFFTFCFRPGPPPIDSSYMVDSARKQEILAGQTCPYSPARPCPTTLHPPCNRSHHVFSSPGCGTLAHDKIPPWFKLPSSRRVEHPMLPARTHSYSWKSSRPRRPVLGLWTYTTYLPVCFPRWPAWLTPLLPGPSWHVLRWRPGCLDDVGVAPCKLNVVAGNDRHIPLSSSNFFSSIMAQFLTSILPNEGRRDDLFYVSLHTIDSTSLSLFRRESIHYIPPSPHP
ncbi:hypothetical protein CDEST_06680 [Colletotrichum destructivum]|uniref:Uncharacterized protein n=1 Tax=Colletotrichum destructivum TaxID=34406 RepID=A0AAX4IE61_9PEZI|nr:hypothetical protein CDEST_06680 [Colletotrichum destructivum]